MRGGQRAGRITLVVLSALVIVIGVSLLATLSRDTGQMTSLDGQWVVVHYETERQAAEEVLAVLEASAPVLAHELGFSTAPRVDVYVYDQQSTAQAKKYGWLEFLHQYPR